MDVWRLSPSGPHMWTSVPLFSPLVTIRLPVLTPFLLRFHPEVSLRNSSEEEAGPSSGARRMRMDDDYTPSGAPPSRRGKKTQGSATQQLGRQQKDKLGSALSAFHSLRPRHTCVLRIRSRHGAYFRASFQAAQITPAVSYTARHPHTTIWCTSAKPSPVK